MAGKPTLESAADAAAAFRTRRREIVRPVAGFFTWTSSFRVRWCSGRIEVIALAGWRSGRPGA
jgi:hypothetical protein